MTTLQFAGLKPVTVRSYRQALRRFFKWLEAEEEETPATYSALDHLLSHYLEHMWLDDEPITYAGHLLSALRRFLPESRWRIPRAKQYFANWQTTHVSHPAAPLPAMAVLGMAGLAMSTKQPKVAAILLLGYLAFLRTGEMVQLSTAKITVDYPRGRILIALPGTKTSRGREETVCVVDDRGSSFSKFFMSGSVLYLFVARNCLKFQGFVS